MIAALAATAVLISGSATAYHPCDGSTSVMASGKQGRVGYVANNTLRFGTWIEMRRPRTVMNRRWFQVQDRGGPGFTLDFWAPSCSWMGSFGRRSVTFKVVPRSELFRGRPFNGWHLVRAAHGAKLTWRPR